MIIISGTIFIHSEQRENAITAMINMATETHKEEGCLVYTFSTDLTDTAKFYVYEEWETPEALDAHGASAHMADFRTALSTAVSAPPEIKRYYQING